MSEEQKNASEVARILKTIDDEYQAAKQGLLGLAYGVPQHEFINTKLGNIQKAKEELEKLVGEEEAQKMVVEQMNKSSKGGDKQQ